MKIIITAGGGHFSPALAVIESLPKNIEVLIIGRKHSLEGDEAISLEYSYAQKLDIPFKDVVTGRLQRKWTRYTLLSLIKFPQGVIQAYNIVKNFRPDIVLSFGGYVSLPVVIASSLLRIPIVVHEQTFGAGLSNRIAGFLARKICISWEESRKFFPKDKTILTGNPIRKFSTENKKEQFTNNEKLPVIYVTGGSLGSHPINVLIEGCLKRLLESYIVIHQTGDAHKYGDFDRLCVLKNKLKGQLKSRYNLVKFFPPNRVGEILKNSTIVVSRAGINTVCELIMFQKPSILIPLPFSQSHEQKQNALFLKNLGLGEVLDQESTNSEKLYKFLISMISKINSYKVDTKYVRLISDADKRLVEVLHQVVKE